MFDLFVGLDFWVGSSLAMALAFVLAYEFINGFHDTASRFLQFSGRVAGRGRRCLRHRTPAAGGTADQDSGRGLVMVFSMLASAIAWNFGTWYFGIPASSFHTLIGSILGVGLANAWLTDLSIGEGINWGKATDIGLSLVVSPVPVDYSFC